MVSAAALQITDRSGPSFSPWSPGATYEYGSNRPLMSVRGAVLVGVVSGAVEVDEPGVGQLFQVIQGRGPGEVVAAPLDEQGRRILPCEVVQKVVVQRDGG